MRKKWIRKIAITKTSIIEFNIKTKLELCYLRYLNQRRDCYIVNNGESNYKATELLSSIF